MLRHQLAVLRRTVRGRPVMTSSDRALWIGVADIDAVAGAPRRRRARDGHSLAWLWTRKIRWRRGRPVLDTALRRLIATMTRANPTWGAPRIHGELLKLGIEVGQTTAAKYMPRRKRPPSSSWRSFLETHVAELVSIDFFTVPTANFRVLYGFVVLANARRRIVHFNVTAHPTAEDRGNCSRHSLTIRRRDT